MQVICYDLDGNQLDHLTQWDVGRKILIKGAATSGEIMLHFCNSCSTRALVVPAEITSDGIVAPVPNLLLQEPLPIIAYMYYHQNDGSAKTLHTVTIPVIPRKKPFDYNYVENIEYANWVELEKEARELLKEAGEIEEAKKKMLEDAAKLEEEKRGFLESAEQTLTYIHNAASEDAPAMVYSTFGKVIAIPDASDQLIQGLTLYGKTTQFTTTGKNLLSHSISSQITGGITVTVHPDKSISLVGTATALVNLWFDNILANLKVGEAYKGYGFTAFRVVENGSTSYMSLSKTLSVTEGMTQIMPYVQIQSGESVNKTIYPIVCLASTTDNTYEPYTGGKPSPNPDYPQELVSAGNGGAINTKVLGKSLIPFPFQYMSYTTNGISYSVDSAGIITANGNPTNASQYSNCHLYNGNLSQQNSTFYLPAGKYKLICSGQADVNKMYALVYERSEDNTSYTEIAYTRYKNEVEFTLEKDVKHAYLVLACLPGYAPSNEKIRIAIVPADASSEIPDYVATQTLTASTPNGLPGIPVTSGGNYTDENGQQWICDEIDFARGVYVQRVRKLDFSTFNWKATAYSNEVQKGYYAKVNGFYNSRHNFFHTHYRWLGREINSGSGANSLGASQSVFDTRTIGEIGFCSKSEGQDYFGVVVGINDGTPVGTLQLVCVEPIETPLSTEELAQYAALHTNKPSTTVHNDAGAGMNVDYIADTKIAVDNKIIEVRNGITRESELKHAPVIVEEKSGSVISVSDSSDWDTHGLTLYGKTTQVTTTGKNLYSGGDLFSISVYRNITLEKPLPPGEYTLSAVVVSNDTDGISSLVSFVSGNANGNNVNVLLKRNNRASVKVTLTAEVSTIRFCAGPDTSNSSGDTAEYTDIQIEAGSAATEYEPYSGGIASPSPDWPQELVSAGNGGAINTTVCGKNINPYTSFGNYGFSGTGEINIHETFFGQKDLIPVVGGLSVSAQCFGATSTGSTGYPYITLFDKNKVRIGRINDANPVSLPKDAAYIGVHWWTNGAYTWAENAGIVVEYGNATLTAYEPYKGQNLTASTPNGLSGIPVTSGGNYTDENGQSWVCDEIDFSRGVYVRRIGIAVYDGSDDEEWQVLTTRSGSKRFLIQIPTSKPVDSTKVANLLNSQFLPMSADSIYADDTLGCAINQNSSLIVHTPQIQTLDALKAHLENKPMTVAYELATPIETPLSTEELAQYAALHTNKPSTTVHNDAGAGMKLAYAADTKLYIDKLIAAVSAAVLNNT